MSVSLKRELHFGGSGVPETLQEASENRSQNRCIFCVKKSLKNEVKRAPKRPQNHSKKPPETNPKKQQKKREKEVGKKPVLVREREARYSFETRLKKSAHRPNMSIAPLARSLRSLASCARHAHTAVSGFSQVSPRLLLGWVVPLGVP